MTVNSIDPPFLTKSSNDVTATVKVDPEGAASSCLLSLFGRLRAPKFFHFNVHFRS